VVPPEAVIEAFVAHDCDMGTTSLLAPTDPYDIVLRSCLISLFSNTTSASKKILQVENIVSFGS
jgi:hypothetical protein